MTTDPGSLFSLRGKVAIVTGGTGVLGSAMATGLAAAGARVGVLGRRTDRARQIVEGIAASGGEALPLTADVLDRDQLEVCRDAVLNAWSSIDIVVNAAGGHVAEAIVTGDRTFFTLPAEALDAVMRLNWLGTVLPTQVFGAVMARQAGGSIINISSMAASRPLTNAIGYSSAKAAIDNLTRWLAVEFARKYGPGLRVNAIAPGFFVAEQNRSLLLDQQGGLTRRGEAIISHTPMARFGSPDDLVGTVIWLAGDGSRFVTGVVVPVDGGFSAFAGV
jgi:NAD(P)-dependent dehydrogenase (short-subunit alcohol dehydrogenase family)